MCGYYWHNLRSKAGCCIQVHFMCEEAPAPLTCQAKVSGSMARQQYGPSRGIQKKTCRHKKKCGAVISPQKYIKRTWSIPKLRKNLPSGIHCEPFTRKSTLEPKICANATRQPGNKLPRLCMRQDCHSC